MPRWPWSRDAHEAPGLQPEAPAPAPNAPTEAVVEVSQPAPVPTTGSESVQRAVETAPLPVAAAPTEPRGLRSVGEIGLTMQGHDSAINAMSPVGEMGGLRQTAWIFAEGERLANENESELMAQRLVDRAAVRRSFEPDAFYDSLASLTSFREQGGFAEADGELVLNDQFPATREATGTFPPMGSAATRGSASQAPSFPSAAAQRPVSRAVDAKFSDPSAAPSPSSGLVVDQGRFAAPTPTPQAPPPRAVARWAADPPSLAPPVAPRAADTPRAPAPAPASDEPAIQRLADRESSPSPRAEAPDPGDEPARAAVAPRAVVEPPRPTDAAPELPLTEPVAGPAAPASGQETSLQRHTRTSPEAAPLSAPPLTPVPSPGSAPPPVPVEAEASILRTPAAESSPALPATAEPPPEGIQRTPANTGVPTPTVEATPGGVAQPFDSPLELNLPVSEATGAAEHTLQRSLERAVSPGESTSPALVAGTPVAPGIERAPDPAAPQPAAAAPPAEVQTRADRPEPMSTAGVTTPAQPGQTGSAGLDAPIQRVSVDAPVATAHSSTPEMPLVASGADSGAGREFPEAVDVSPGSAAGPVERAAPVASDAPALPAPAQPEMPQVGSLAPAAAAAAAAAAQVTPPTAPQAPLGAAPESGVQRHAAADETRSDIARAIAEPGGPAETDRELDLPLAESAGLRGEPVGSTGHVRRAPDGESRMSPPPSAEPGPIAAIPPVVIPAALSTPGPLAGETVLRAADPATATTRAAQVPGTTTTPPVPGEQAALAVRAEASAGGAIARTPDLTLATEHAASGSGPDSGSDIQRPSHGAAAGDEASPATGAPADAPIARSVAPAPAMAEPSGTPVAPLDTELALHTPLATPDQPGVPSGGAPPTATTPLVHAADVPPATASPGAAPAAVPLQRTMLPAEASAPPTSRQPAELTLNEPPVARPGPEGPSETAAQRASQPGGGRVDRSPDRATPAARVETSSTSTGPASAEAGSAPALEGAQIQRAVAQAGVAADMPDLDLAVFQTAELGAAATLSPETLPGAGGETPAASPSVQRAVAEAGSPAGMPDLDLAVPQQREPTPGAAAGSREDAVMRAAETPSTGAARPEPVRATPASPSPTATTGVPAMDLAHQAPAQGSETGGPIRRRVETTGAGASTAPPSPGGVIGPVPPAIARPGPVSGESLVTGAGPLELSTAVARSIEPAEDAASRPEPVLASPGGTPPGQGPTLEFATALRGVVGGGSGAMESGGLARSSIGRAIDRATAPLARPAPVQPQQTSQMARLEQPLFAAPTAPQAAGSPEQVMRAYAQSAPVIGAGASAREISNGASAELEFVERTVSGPMEAFGAVTSVQREVTETGSNEPKDLSQDQVRDLSEKVWQYVRRELRIERDRQRGRP